MVVPPKTFKFIATVSTRGSDEYVINIPKKHHKEAAPLLRKGVVVTVEEIPV